MARASTNKNYFSFVKGLITEANPLTYPEGATLDESNMDLKVDGSRVRRLAIDYEIGNVKTTLTGSNAINMATWVSDAFEWRGVAGISTLNHLIVQHGRYLYVHNLDVTVISGTPIYTVDLATFKSAEQDWTPAGVGYTLGVNPILDDRIGDYPVQICYGGGRAYVTSPNTEPFYIEYNSTTGTYSSTQIIQKIRDVRGLDNDGYLLSERPAVGSMTGFVTNAQYHSRYYTLLNSGWKDANIETYIVATGTAPSGADVWTYGKDANDVFQPAWLNKQDFGDTPSPNGRFVYSNYFYEPLGRLTHALANPDVTLHRVSTYQRPKACAYYASRLWTAGVDDTRHSGEILFSRVIEKAADVEECYQRADPTSEIISALQPDDGGTIRIPETGAIHRLIPIANGVAVLAKNGVWMIKGAVDGGFTADTFSVVKVTSIGTDSPRAAVEVEGSIVYAARAGLYTLTPNRIGSLDAQNMTQNTIQKEFTKIPYSKLTEMKAVFDSVEREVKFYYNLDSNAPKNSWYNEVLTYDTRLNAFYRASFAGDTTIPYVTAVFTTLNINPNGSYITGLRHVCVEDNGAGLHDATVAVLHNTSYRDWQSFDGVGVSYQSYFETGYEIFGDAMRNKQVDYLFVYMERTELTATNGVEDNQSSCNLQVKFDWSDSASSQKWTSPIEIYKYQQPYLLQYSATNPGVETIDYGLSVITKKEKVRGTGKAIRLRFESSPGKAMHVLGWAISTSGETAV